jgi:ketosteroid isomerase-like protein
MKKYRIIHLASLIALLATGRMAAQEAAISHQDSLIAVIEQYYDLNLKIFQVNSTVADIDSAFELFTDDFTYVHPRYGGTYTRKELYDGYLQNQQNGNYDGNVRDIAILNRIVGLNAVAVQKRFVEKKDGENSQKDPEMTLFEFRNGKIYRITEYW